MVKVKSYSHHTFFFSAMRQFFVSVLEVLEVALIAIGAVFFIRNFLVQPFLVSGSSMDPNFHDGDYLLVDELTYRFRAPERGEVAVFRYPNDESTYFIKRVVGLPGERVSVRSGKVVISDKEHPDGFTLDEKYLPGGMVTGGNTDITLGEREYFVLGDNRSYSFDSRSWGILNGKEIIGIVRLRLWPILDLRAFAAPEY